MASSAPALDEQARELAAWLRGGGPRRGGGGTWPGAGSRVRSVAWRAALGALPPCAALGGPRGASALWPHAAARLRHEYEALRDKVVVNPHARAAAGEPLFDPLGASSAAAPASEDPWVAFHKDKELLEEIAKDLERLYPSGCGELFQLPQVSETLRQVLFVWSKLHPDTSYRQGMHELAATLLYCLYHEAVPSRKRGGGGKGGGGGGGARDTAEAEAEAEAAARAVLEEVLDMKYLEHDLFWLFERVMRDLKPLYRRESQMTAKEIQRAKQAVLRRGRDEMSGIAEPGAASAGAGTGSCAADVAPVLAVANYIQNDLLLRADAALARNLADLQIAPQLYALRWLRLLFGRELAMTQTLLLWDALLVDAMGMRTRLNSSPEELPKPDADDAIRGCAAGAAAAAAAAAGAAPAPFSVEGSGLPASAAYVAVALLTSQRDTLLTDDYNTVLTTLMKFPEVQDVGPIVERAFALRDAMANAPSASGPALDADAAAFGGSLKTPQRVLGTSLGNSEQTRGRKPGPRLAGVASASTGASRTRDPSPSRVGNFFKDLGEKLENLFDDKEPPRWGATPRPSSSFAAASQRPQATQATPMNATAAAAGAPPTPTTPVPGAPPAATPAPIAKATPSRRGSSAETMSAAELAGLQSRMGQRLASIVSKMEDSLVATESTVGERDAEVLPLLAQIKQVRDVLLGRVTESECFV
jgi:hypothetical protein